MKIRLPASSMSLLALPVALAACAQNDRGFPSLAPRPIEQRGEEIETPPPTPPAPASATLRADLDRLLKKARDGESAFAALLDSTEQAVSRARGAAPSSEAWVTAQQLLSALDAARAETASALAELDSLYVDLADKATRDATAGGVEEAYSARSEVEGINNRQIARLTELQAALKIP